MQSKTGIIILIILVVVVASLAIVVAGGIGGSKVTVTGTVFYAMWPGHGWGITCDGVSVKEDDFISSPLWYFPWETKDINVVVEMSNGETYTADCWTGKLFLVLGSVPFSVDLRHIPDGSYMGVIYLYEVEKGLIWGEKTRILQGSTSFEVNV